MNTYFITITYSPAGSDLTLSAQLVTAADPKATYMQFNDREDVGRVWNVEVAVVEEGAVLNITNGKFSEVTA